MLYLITSILLFILSIFIHLIWCRHKDVQQLNIALFFFISSVCLLIYFGAVYFHPYLRLEDTRSLWKFPLKLTAAFLYILLVPYYPVLYYSSFMHSPTQIIVLLLKEQGGITLKELSQHINDERFIIARLNSLIKNGYIAFDGYYYRLVPKTILFCRILNIYQKLLGREMGG